MDNSRPPLSAQQFNQLQRKIKNQYEQSGNMRFAGCLERKYKLFYYGSTQPIVAIDHN
jgi:hypothetical protein